MIKWRSCLSIVAVLLCESGAAQSKQGDSTTVVIGLQGHYGWILAHTRDVIDISQSHPWGLTAEVSRIRHTQQSWNACNCISQNGISLSYFNYNNPEVLGSSFNLALFGEPTLIHGKINLSLRGGAGLSYITRIYHPETNPDNIFFSQPLSGLLLVQLNTRIQLTENWSGRLGVAYNHISNGGSRQPNKGMNFPMLNAGIDYLINPLPVQSRAKVRTTSDATHFYGGVLFNTRKANVEGERKPMIGVQAGLYKPFTLTNAAGLAVEASYDAALKARAKDNSESYDHMIVSGLLRHHFLFGNFDFSQALGIYFHNQQPNAKEVFQRYALEYSIWKHLKVGFSLKAHLQVAEQMDIRITAVF